MKKLYILCLLLASILIYSNACFSATVGNPLDLDVPSTSSMLRQQMIEDTMDEVEQVVKIKTSFDAEFVFDKDLRTPTEVKDAELEGQWYMAKIGTTIFNKIEPYIKLGTCTLKAEWSQNDNVNMEVDSDYGFAWGGGIKAILWDIEDWGVRLTGDFQYRTTDLDADEITRGNTSVINPGAEFEVSEYQLSLAISKKFELPLKWQNIYLVPYTGITFSDSDVDVSFRDSTLPTTDFALFSTSEDNPIGYFLGLDILPSLTSSFIYSLEVRLMNEFALTLGGTMKF
ncbi:MAG: hypothetical protein ABH848_02760 [Candidatus Omnitrophota bacterium]